MIFIFFKPYHVSAEIRPQKYNLSFLLSFTSQSHFILYSTNFASAAFSGSSLLLSLPQSMLSSAVIACKQRWRHFPQHQACCCWPPAITVQTFPCKGSNMIVCAMFSGDQQLGFEAPTEGEDVLGHTDMLLEWRWAGKALGKPQCFTEIRMDLGFSKSAETLRMPCMAKTIPLTQHIW